MSNLPSSDELEPLPQPPPAEVGEGETSPARTQAQQRFLRRSFGRWLLMAPMRLLYRLWTRVAAHLFPEESRRAQLVEQMGVALPDRMDMSWVTGSLAVGGRVREEDIERLARVGVTRVIDTRSEYRDDEAALNRAGVQLLYLPTPDTHPLTVEDLMAGSAWALEQIRDGQRVLIHCEHGVGRSVLLTCAVLVRDGYSVEAALRLVQMKRWQASPNHRQIKRLHEFEEAVQAESTTVA
ncbi:MAG TPA: dual specificity protein phosphatase [Ktedonobacterales bacterium]|nr:dual specificity protein phosphatase [Ktedonobacterales bacterium]